MAADVVQIGEQVVCAAMPNRAHTWDLRAPGAAVGRLPLGGITGLGALNVGAGAVATTLLAAAGGSVRCYDTRMLPAEDPSARKPPPHVAELLPSIGGLCRLTSVDAAGAFVVAGDAEGGLHVWDLASANE
eukprot:1505805-Prymnesium_polylepis.1